jgi:hypothetical protein
MGQNDVFLWLKYQSLRGEKYYTAEEIKQGLRDDGHSEGTVKSVNKNLLKLEVFGYIDGKVNFNIKHWVRCYRYIKEED